MPLTIIVGKNSNLSNAINNKLNDCILISSRDVIKNSAVLYEFKNKKINIIFNNFQTAVRLNSMDNCSEYVSNSILSTSIVLDYFKNETVNKIIYTSSSSVYGNNILCNEKDELRPLNLHAALKMSNEKLIEKYCLDNKIDYTIARVFNMYGGNDNFSIISKIIDAHLNKKELNIVNNGNAIRDFIHIDDVVSIYLKILDMKDINILNIGTGQGNSIKSILDYLLNKDVKIQTNNLYRNELKISTADTKLLHEVINKKSFIKVEEYLKQELNL